MIVVRVNDTGGGGGMWGAPEDQYVAIGQEKIDISGDWKFKISKAVMQDIDLGPNSYPTLLFNGMINPICSIWNKRRNLVSGRIKCQPGKTVSTCISEPYKRLACTMESG